MLLVFRYLLLDAGPFRTSRISRSREKKEFILSSETTPENLSVAKRRKRNLSPVTTGERTPCPAQKTNRKTNDQQSRLPCRLHYNTAPPSLEQNRKTKDRQSKLIYSLHYDILFVKPEMETLNPKANKQQRQTIPQHQHNHKRRHQKRPEMHHMPLLFQCTRQSNHVPEQIRQENCPERQPPIR